ncbi:MAG: Beta-galactosidase [Planctomycetes bacterium ADurb.Bin401]|nr:MAG: Beta-galactosidase [Planctomycetes bacterium ADurb.Bin401]
MQKKIKKAAKRIPFLKKQGDAVQLIVGGRPFLILGGELGNSTASSLESLKAFWPRLKEMRLNTVLAPVYWDLIEPVEGKFDFELVDALIAGARKNKMRVVLLWFGSWKNSMSCYVPGWVKTDQKRFPRARLKNGKAMEILSAFSDSNLQGDIKAFTAMMRHVRKIDGKHHTVILVQVENEIGMLEDVRDYCDLANKAFEKNPEDEEIFMARHYARFTNKVAKAGKAEYALPMYVNAALNQDGQKPGEYPSAGPLPHLFNVWRQEAKEIDFLSPDIYHPVFEEWCERYHKKDNPLFIPEAGRGNENAVKAFFAFGQHDAIGFSPFAIEATQGDTISELYDVLSQLSPMILENQGKGTMAGVSLNEEHKTQEVKLGRYVLKVSHDYTFQWTTRETGTDKWPNAGGLIIQNGDDEYIIAGRRLIVTFSPNPSTGEIAGIKSIQEGRFVNGRWIGGKWMNGDQSHQGRHLNLPGGKFGIQKVSLYRYH